MHRSTRIHLDTVQGLGTFVELEVVLEDDQPAQQGESVAHELMAALQIAPEDLVPVAYAELLLEEPEVIDPDPT